MHDARYWKKLATLCVLLSVVRRRVFLGLTHHHVKITEFGELAVNFAAARNNVIHLHVSCMELYWYFLMHFYHIEL
jgi:hypothetical protein